MLNRKPAVIEDIYEDDRIPHDFYRPTFVKSLVRVPIRAEMPICAIGIYWAEHHVATESKSDYSKHWPTQLLSRWRTCGL